MKKFVYTLSAILLGTLVSLGLAQQIKNSTTNLSSEIITLPSGQTEVTRVLVVPGAVSTLFMTVDHSSGVTPTLQAPDGSNAAPTESGPDGALYEVQDPSAGTWTLTLAHDGSVERNALVEWFNTGSDLPRVGVLVDYTQSAGTPTIVSVPVFLRNAPIIGAIVKVQITRADGALAVNTTARDDGAAFDAETGDGLYSAGITGLAAGFYMASATITLPDGDALAASEFFEVFPSTATLTGGFTDKGVDVNTDGLIDRLDITLGVDVDRAGEYAAEILLRASNGNETWTRDGFAVLDAGSTEITTSLDAQRLRENLGVNGPYELSDVRLLWNPASASTQPMRHIASRLLNLGFTQPYNWPPD
ncbi:MAG: hypothetical protein LC667_20730 [Thioalkalivibrio sp.]|nr:hypothetical protein [Thioalkalivibrio sp.]